MTNFQRGPAYGMAGETAPVAAITAALAAVLDVPAADVKIRSITPAPGHAPGHRDLAPRMWSRAGRRDQTAARSTFPMGRRNS